MRNVPITVGGLGKGALALIFGACFLLVLKDSNSLSSLEGQVSSLSSAFDTLLADAKNNEMRLEKLEKEFAKFADNLDKRLSDLKIVELRSEIAEIKEIPASITKMKQNMDTLSTRVGETRLVDVETKLADTKQHVEAIENQLSTLSTNVEEAVLKLDQVANLASKLSTSKSDPTATVPKIDTPKPPSSTTQPPPKVADDDSEPSDPLLYKPTNTQPSKPVSYTPPTKSGAETKAKVEDSNEDYDAEYHANRYNVDNSQNNAQHRPVNKPDVGYDYRPQNGASGFNGQNGGGNQQHRPQNGGFNGGQNGGQNIGKYQHYRPQNGAGGYSGSGAQNTGGFSGAQNTGGFGGAQNTGGYQQRTDGQYNAGDGGQNSAGVRPPTKLPILANQNL